VEGYQKEQLETIHQFMSSC